MATLTEMVAAVVVHSSAAAFSHFGVIVDTPKAQAPPSAEQRVVARTPAPRRTAAAAVVEKASTCPEAQRAHVIKA